MPAFLKALSIKMLRIGLLVALFMAMAGIGTYIALTLIFSSEEPVIVPDLVGRDVLVGLEVLSDLGLNTRVKGIPYDDQVPKNHIIDQEPEPGSTIKKGRDVKIRVSRGPESIVMPNLSGLSLQQSRILLTENGLCEGKLAAMTRMLQTAGRIIAHSPMKGTTVTRGTCVDLLISRGTPPVAVAMTDLDGFTLEAAIRRLEQEQLTVGEIRRIYREDAPIDTIVGQIPIAGDRIPLGSRVDLTVNRAVTAPSTGNRSGTDPVELFRYALDNGFLNRRVRVELKQRQTSITLWDEFVAPGDEIWLLIPKSGNPTVLVYVDGRLAESRILDGS